MQSKQTLTGRREGGDSYLEPLIIIILLETSFFTGYTLCCLCENAEKSVAVEFSLSLFLHLVDFVLGILSTKEIFYLILHIFFQKGMHRYIVMYVKQMNKYNNGEIISIKRNSYIPREKGREREQSLLLRTLFR